MTKFTFRIISTIQVGTINEGDALYGPETCPDGDFDVFDNAADAEDRAQDILNGLSGDRAFNEARDSADIEVIEVR